MFPEKRDFGKGVGRHPRRKKIWRKAREQHVPRIAMEEGEPSEERERKRVVQSKRCPTHIHAAKIPFLSYIFRDKTDNTRDVAAALNPFAGRPGRLPPRGKTSLRPRLARTHTPTHFQSRGHKTVLGYPREPPFPLPSSVDSAQPK